MNNKGRKKKKNLLCFDVEVEHWHWVAGPGNLLTGFWSWPCVTEVPTTSWWCRSDEVCIFYVCVELNESAAAGEEKWLKFYRN